jgi:hypothetical protein
MIILIVAIFLLLFTGIWLYQDFAGGIDAVTSKIKRRWLKVTLRILLKIVTLTFIVAGVIATAILAIIMNYDPKKKK